MFYIIILRTMVTLGVSDLQAQKAEVMSYRPYPMPQTHVIWLIRSCYSKSGEFQVQKMRRQTAWFRTLPSSLRNMMAQAMPDPIFTHQ